MKCGMLHDSGLSAMHVPALYAGLCRLPNMVDPSSHQLQVLLLGLPG